ncbi:MFS transporter [Methylocella silvestris]|nr:MFS transporter [Methylocella silvestris]
MREPTESAAAPQRSLYAVMRRLGREPAPLAWITRQSWSPWLVVGLVCVGAFLGQLDATIVQLALPTLGKTFAAPLQQVSWVALAYLVAFASFLPIFGRLCEIVGRKSLYLTGYALFVVASALCGLSTNLNELIVFRVLQGIGGSLLGANSISILVAAIGPKQRGKALGIFAAAQAVGMSAGPAVGGLILAALDWRWLFWLAAPFGTAAIVVGWLALPQTETAERDKRFDWRGAVLIGPALIFLIVALNHLSAQTSPLTMAFLAGSSALGWLLIRHERASPRPLVDLLLFRSRAFCCGAIAVALAYALLYSMFFLMSFALEHGYGDSPAAAGLRLAIIPVALGATAPFSGALSDRFGAPLLSAAGMACCFGALLMLVLGGQESGGAHFVAAAAFALFGAGLGAFIAPNNHSTIEAAPARLSGEAGSMLNLMRVLGASLGVAAATASLSWRLEVAGGGQNWLGVTGASLLGAVASSLMIPAGLAALAAAAALCATAPRAPKADLS